MFLNDKEVKTKESAKIDIDAKTGINYFVISKVSADHAGSYTIKASNNIGEVEHSFELIILGKEMLFLNK